MDQDGRFSFQEIFSFWLFAVGKIELKTKAKFNIFVQRFSLL